MIDRRKFLATMGTLPVLAAPALRAAQRPLTFRVTGSFPRSMHVEGEGWRGFEVEIFYRIAELARPTQIVECANFFNWKRALKSIEHGDLDMMAGVSHREDRVPVMDFIGTMDTEAIYLVTRRETEVPVLDTADKLTTLGGNVQVNFDAAWHPDFDRRIKEDAEFRSHFVNVSGSVYSADEFIDYTLKRVYFKRTSGAIVAYYTAIRMRDRSVTDDPLERPFKINLIEAFGAPPTFLVASRKLDPVIRDALREGYQRAREDGSFDEIWTKWYADRPIPDNFQV